jgi:hypothetical protein
MADYLETTIAPAAIERAMSIFEGFKDRNHAALVQTRKALTDHIFGQIAAGQTDRHRLVVSGLTYLKSLERMAESGKPLRSNPIPRATSSNSTTAHAGRPSRATSTSRSAGSPRLI